MKFTTELGKFIPSTLLALKIARVFGATVEQLFEPEPGDE
ncbi:DNA-binding XRE family transcriptional regulator [Chitinophaga sp. OAE865]